MMSWKRSIPLFFAGCAAQPGLRAKQLGIHKDQTCPAGVFYLYNEKDSKSLFPFDKTYSRADCETYRKQYTYNPDDKQYAYSCDEFFGEPESSAIKYFPRDTSRTQEGPACSCSAQEARPHTFTFVFPKVDYKYHPDVNTQAALKSDWSDWVHADAYKCQTDAERFGFHTLTEDQTCPEGNFYMYDETDVKDQFARGYSRADCEATGGVKGASVSQFVEPYAYHCDEFFGDDKLEDPKSAIKYFAKTPQTFSGNKPKCKCSDPHVSPSKSDFYDQGFYSPVTTGSSRYVDYKYFPDVNTQSALSPDFNAWVYAYAWTCSTTGVNGVHYGETCPTGTFYTYSVNEYQFQWVGTQDELAGEYTFTQCQKNKQYPQYSLTDPEYSYSCGDFFPSSTKGDESLQKYFGVGYSFRGTPNCSCTNGSPKSTTISPKSTRNYKYFPDVNTQAGNIKWRTGEYLLGAGAPRLYAYAYECQE